MNEQNKRRKMSGGEKAMLLLGGAQGAAMGISVVQFIETMNGDFLTTLIAVIAVFFASMLLSTIIHEGGHLVGGLLSGYKFACFRIFALSIRQSKDGKVRMGIIRTPGMGGQCLMSPPELKDGKMPFRLYHAGGFLMNLLFGAVFVIAAVLLSRQTQAVGGVLGAQFGESLPISAGRAFAVMFCQVMAIANIASALLNGIPLKTNLISNDGQNMIDLSRSADALRRHHADMKIAAGIWQGERLKDMPDEWFSCPSDEELRENGMDAGTAVMYYSRLMDEAGENEQRMQQARALSDRLLSGGVQLAGLHRAVLRMDRAFMEMIEDTPLEYVRREKIAEWLDAPTRQIMKAMKKGMTVQRIEYAQALLIEKDEQKAQKIKAKFDKAARRYPVLTDVESEKSLIALVDRTHERRENDKPKGENDGF